MKTVMLTKLTRRDGDGCYFTSGGGGGGRGGEGKWKSDGRADTDAQTMKNVCCFHVSCHFSYLAVSLTRFFSFHLTRGRCPVAKIVTHEK